MLYFQSKIKTVLLLKSFKQLGELVRAGCGFTATENASESGGGVFYFHTADKSRNALEIAVAAVLEMHILNRVTVEFQFNQAGAYSLRNSDDFAQVPVFRVRNYFHVVTFINLTAKIQKIKKIGLPLRCSPHGAPTPVEQVVEVYAKKNLD